MRNRGHTSNLDVTETKVKETVDRLTVLVESCSDTDRVRELLAPELFIKVSR